MSSTKCTSLSSSFGRHSCFRRKPNAPLPPHRRQYSYFGHSSAVCRGLTFPHLMHVDGVHSMRCRRFSRSCRILSSVTSPSSVLPRGAFVRRVSPLVARVAAHLLLLAAPCLLVTNGARDVVGEDRHFCRSSVSWLDGPCPGCGRVTTPVKAIQLPVYVGALQPHLA